MILRRPSRFRPLPPRPRELPLERAQAEHTPVEEGNRFRGKTGGRAEASGG